MEERPDCAGSNFVFWAELHRKAMARLKFKEFVLYLSNCNNKKTLLLFCHSAIRKFLGFHNRPKTNEKPVSTVAIWNSVQCMIFTNIQFSPGFSNIWNNNQKSIALKKRGSAALHLLLCNPLTALVCRFEVRIEAMVLCEEFFPCSAAMSHDIDVIRAATEGMTHVKYGAA